MIDFETKKTLSDKLSDFLPIKGEKNKKEALELLKKLGYNGLNEPEPDTSNNSTFSVDPFPKGNIGIYKPSTEGGDIAYERDIEYIDRWTFFADLPTIPIKKDKKRVVFLGESVARGFLLDPDYTPAMVLNKLINTNSSNDKFEVIDLAETNLGMRGVKNRFLQCLDLQPDLVVFLAGNNWYEDCLTEVINNKDTFETINHAINKANNIAEVKPELEKVMEGLIVDFMTTVSHKMKEHDFPVIMAIPEFNLLDCRSTPGERRATYLDGDGIKKWSDARRKAQKAQNEGDLEEVARYAQKMIDIDASHPLAYEWLADVKIEQNDHAAGRELLELAKDTALFNRSNSKPRIFQVNRDTILKYAPELGIETLNIAEVFKSHLNGQIPGKELFLDYCHFTVEGIQVAMEPLADQVLTLTGNENKNELSASNIRPSKLTLAMGHFYAAIHNEHWGQPYYIHKYHCQKALEASKEISKIMIYYCDMISRNVINNLTKSLELILEDIHTDRYAHALTHPRDSKLMEIGLVNAMVDVLEMKGLNLATFVNELRKKEHGVDGKTIDLLSPVYHATSFDEFRGFRPAFYEATDSASKFFVVSDKGVSIDLFISFRIPSIGSSIGSVEIWFNDIKIDTLEGQSSWINHEITIPGDHSKDGLNELTILWPIPDSVDKAADQKAKESQSVLNSMYYVFGEISHFRASGVKESVTVGETLESVTT